LEILAAASTHSRLPSISCQPITVPTNSSSPR
jgi:hypothetical protein